MMEGSYCLPDVHDEDDLAFDALVASRSLPAPEDDHRENYHLPHFASPLQERNGSKSSHYHWKSPMESFRHMIHQKQHGGHQTPPKFPRAPNLTTSGFKVENKENSPGSRTNLTKDCQQESTAILLTDQLDILQQQRMQELYQAQQEIMALHEKIGRLESRLMLENDSHKEQARDDDSDMNMSEDSMFFMGDNYMQIAEHLIESLSRIEHEYEVWQAETKTISTDTNTATISDAALKEKDNNYGTNAPDNDKEEDEDAICTTPVDDGKIFEMEVAPTDERRTYATCHFSNEHSHIKSPHEMIIHSLRRLHTAEKNRQAWMKRSKSQKSLMPDFETANRISELQTHLKAVQTKLTDATEQHERQLALCQAELSQRTTDNNQLWAHLQKALCKTEEYRTLLEQKEQELTEATGNEFDLKTLKEENFKLKNKLRELVGALEEKTLEFEILTMESQQSQEDFELHINSLEDRMDKQRSDKEQKCGEQARNELQAAHKQQLETKDNIIRNLEQSLATLKEETEQELRVKNQELNAAEFTLQSLKEKIEMEEIHQRTTALASTQQVVALHEQVNKLQRERAQRQRDRMVSVKRHEQEAKTIGITEQLQRLQDQCNHWAREHASSQNEAESLRRQLEEQAQRHNESHQELQQKLEQAQMEISSLRLELNACLFR